MEIKITCKEDKRVGLLIDSLITALNSYTEEYTIETNIDVKTINVKTINEIKEWNKDLGYKQK